MAAESLIADIAAKKRPPAFSAEGIFLCLTQMLERSINNQIEECMQKKWIIATFFTAVIQTANAAPHLYLDAPAVEYEWHATNLRELGYQFTPYTEMGTQNGLVLRVLGLLTKMPFAEGVFGGYSVSVDLSYRCSVETKNLTGQVIAMLGPITINNYAYLSYSGNLNEPAFRQMASKTMAYALKNNNEILNSDSSRCAEIFATAPKSAEKPSKKR